MPSSLSDNDLIKTAVITGRHSFDVPGFHAAFRSMPGIDAYVQSLDDFVADAGHVREQYDALVFFHMYMETPEGRIREVYETLGESDQGIVVMHHAILAYPQWDLWNDLVGIEDRNFGYHHDVNIPVKVANSDHPITNDLSDFEMIDETYTMDSAGDDSEILLTTDHEQSMTVLAWARQYRNARVFCTESGHDNQTYIDPNFRKFTEQGIKWVAGA